MLLVSDVGTFHTNCVSDDMVFTIHQHHLRSICIDYNDRINILHFWHCATRLCMTKCANSQAKWKTNYETVCKWTRGWIKIYYLQKASVMLFLVTVGAQTTASEFSPNTTMWSQAQQCKSGTETALPEAKQLVVHYHWNPSGPLDVRCVRRRCLGIN